MRLNKPQILLLSFLFMIACANSQDVHYNYDRGAHFFAYKTYQWIETPDAQKVDAANTPPNLCGRGGAQKFSATVSDVRKNGSEDQLIDQEIKCAIDGRLAQKGLTRVEKHGDLQVVYHAAIHQELSIDTFGSGWGGRGYSVLWNGPFQGQRATVPAGTLVVDLYDPATKELIWRGDVNKAIELKKDPNRTYDKLERAAARLFNDYPPLPSK